jgi:hypothetical protein
MVQSHRFPGIDGPSIPGLAGLAGWARAGQGRPAGPGWPAGGWAGLADGAGAGRRAWPAGPGLGGVGRLGRARRRGLGWPTGWAGTVGSAGIDLAEFTDGAKRLADRIARLGLDAVPPADLRVTLIA